MNSSTSDFVAFVPASVLDAQINICLHIIVCFVKKTISNSPDRDSMVVHNNNCRIEC